MTTWTELLDGRLADSAVTRTRLANAMPHYVYVLCRPDGTPFYVGKGVQHRCFHHEAEARNTERLSHKLNVIRAMHRQGEQIRYCIEGEFETEAEAHSRERNLISLFGRHDQRRGPLTNQTDGGEGASNPSEESRDRRRQSLVPNPMQRSVGSGKTSWATLHARATLREPGELFPEPASGSSAGGRSHCQ